MSNNWYTKSTDVVPYTRAKDTDIDTPLSLIEAAFDKLPEPHDTKDGFKTVPISDATELDEAVSAQQVIGGTLTYAVDSGTANAFIITLPIAPTSYYSGLVLWFKAANANTGACTINVNSLGVKSVKNYEGSDLLANDISVGQIVGIAWTGTYFQVISDLPGYARSAEQSAIDAAASAVEASGYADDAETAAQTAVDTHNAATGESVHGLKEASVFDVLGEITVTGGVPSGALFERGENANGKYLKLPDGTVFFSATGEDQDTAQAAGNIYRTELTATWTFPVLCVSPPYFNGAPVNSNRWLGTYCTTGASGIYRQFGYASSASASASRLYGFGQYY